ncbi:MAG TPA: 30S ribosomal protein S17 [bacterium]|jgi:small subunit ribosomal protein S17|nr:30S ribosomal protein S17 [bacterium]HPO11138.1 30S ribosomal protein S17 [bacterium]HPV55131.1 30S ribosomal protein S17 [Bacilli bacterium]
MGEIKSKKIERKLEGVVVSDKMDKTVVVLVKTVKVHPKYKKRYMVSRKFKCHDENKEYHVGDRVIIKQCRPISKDKKYIVVSKK